MSFRSARRILMPLVALLAAGLVSACVAYPADYYGYGYPYGYYGTSYAYAPAVNVGVGGGWSWWGGRWHGRW